MASPPRSSTSPQPAADRLPPQDRDAEMALLGSMMMSRDAISEVIPLMGRRDAAWFYLPAHQSLFEVLLDMYDDPTKAVDLIVVSDELRRRGLLEKVGGQDYMIQLAESFAEWANAEHYARIVRDKGMLRDLIRCAGEISNDAYAALDDAREILDRAEQKIFHATERRVSGHAIAIRDAMARLSRQLDPDQRESASGIRTGFTLLDEYTSGFQRGDLVIVAARPSMGKTALGLSMAENMSLDGTPVVFFSMEMSSDQVAQRLVSSYTGIDSKSLRKRMLSEQDHRDLCDAQAAFHDAALFIDDTPGMTAMELRSKARRLKLKHDIQAVFVDYLQLMHTPGSENRQVEIAGISRNLKGLARELSVPVIAMAQLNRMSEGRSDKRPQMSDLRESGAIEQDADAVLLIHREEYYIHDHASAEYEAAQGKAELIIAKQRNGPTGTVELSFNKKRTRFDNLYVGPTLRMPRAAAVPSRDDVPF